MKKEKGFLSFIDDLKSEINNIKTQIDEVGIDERKSNHVKTSNKSKAKKNNKNKKNKSYENNNFEDYESPEGTSVMTSTFEGNTLTFNRSCHSRLTFIRIIF